MNVHATFAGGQSKNEIDTGQGPQSKDIPVQAGAVVVNANLPLYPWTMLAMRASLHTREPQQVPVYVIGQAEVTASVVFKGRERVEFAGKTAELDHLNVSGTTPQGPGHQHGFLGGRRPQDHQDGGAISRRGSVSRTVSSPKLPPLLHNSQRRKDSKQ